MICPFLARSKAQWHVVAFSVVRPARRFEAFLGGLESMTGAASNTPQAFQGCGSLDVGALTTLALRNVGGAAVRACVDHILIS